MRENVRFIELHELETLAATGAILSVVYEGVAGGFGMRIRAAGRLRAA